MAKTRTFISFDYDHDSDLKLLLVGQAKNSDSPFEITDMSIKETIDSKVCFTSCAMTVPKLTRDFFCFCSSEKECEIEVQKQQI